MHDERQYFRWTSRGKRVAIPCSKGLLLHEEDHDGFMMLELKGRNPLFKGSTVACLMAGVSQDGNIW